MLIILNLYDKWIRSPWPLTVSFNDNFVVFNMFLKKFTSLPIKNYEIKKIEYYSVNLIPNINQVQVDDIFNIHPQNHSLAIINDALYMLKKNFTHSEYVKLKSGEIVKGIFVGKDKNNQDVFFIKDDIRLELLDTEKKLFAIKKDIENKFIAFNLTTTPVSTNYIVQNETENFLHKNGFTRFIIIDQELQSSTDFIKSIDYYNNTIEKD